MRTLPIALLTGKHGTQTLVSQREGVTSECMGTASVGLLLHMHLGLQAVNSEPTRKNVVFVPATNISVQT